MSQYRVTRSATRIEAPGGKLIEELFGRVADGEERFSLAHMVAPPQWSEPPQRPQFGEITIVVRGRLEIEVAGEETTLGPGEALWVEPEVRVVYSNPFDLECEYYAICLPAFSPDLAGREE